MPLLMLMDLNGNATNKANPIEYTFYFSVNTISCFIYFDACLIHAHSSQGVGMIGPLSHHRYGTTIPRCTGYTIIYVHRGKSTYLEAKMFSEYYKNILSVDTF